LKLPDINSIYPTLKHLNTVPSISTPIHTQNRNIFTPDHSLKLTPRFPSEQLTPNAQEKPQTMIGPASPGGHHPFCQAIYAETHSTYTGFESPGGTGIHRQALNPEMQ